MERSCWTCRFQDDTFEECAARNDCAFRDARPAWEPKEPVTLPAAPEPQPELLHSFSHALLLLKMGKRVAREGWNGKGMSLRLIEAQAPNRLPYVEMTTVQGTLVPWLASQTDLLAEDWVRLD